ncbi:RcnB family protein [Candidatus Pantoea multigeneris]|uniref:RcnB family protein n=1 Tax=Candidatus Pantoea multigeneris TaxID=2608357 RepID=A0ABX0RD88_9GAMM|nr:RcnB family protein [Pantoea multigeneris]NIF22543.1 hypothetical protein [Pantoea multigeneris]
MVRSKVVLFTAGLLLGGMSLAVQAEDAQAVPQPPQVAATAPADAQSQAPVAAQPETPAAAPQAKPGKFDLTTIVIDYKEYKVGDIVPQAYTDKAYTITEWQKRNLSAPDAGTHWAYINANYILITDEGGRIVKGVSGDIFFKG